MSASLFISIVSVHQYDRQHQQYITNSHLRLHLHTFHHAHHHFYHVMSIIIKTCFSAVSSVSSAMFCSIKRFALFCLSSCFSASSRWTLIVMVTMRIRSMTTTTMVMMMRVVLPLQLFLCLFSMQIDHDGHDEATMVSWMTTTTTWWWWWWLLLLLLLVTKAN